MRSNFDLFNHKHCSTDIDINIGYYDQPGDLSPDKRQELVCSLNDSFKRSTCDLKKIKREQTINDRFLNCGKQGTFYYCPECGLKYYTKYFCHFKLCDTCSRIYGKKFKQKILELMHPILSNRKKGWTVAMLTLSESSAKYRGRYPNPDEYKSFNKKVGEFCRLFYSTYRARISKNDKVIENRKIYKGAGWFAVNEFGSDNNNLHTHILLYGPWIPHSVLLKNWVRLSGGDTGCHIEPIRSPEIAARYVSKYITKPPVFNQVKTAIDYLQATKGQRRIRSGGIFYNILKMVEKKTPYTCPFCSVCLAYGGIIDLSQTHDGLNLSYIRKHRDKFETEALREAVRFLPSGVMPINLPYCPSLATN